MVPGESLTFVDTNILFYSIDLDSAGKREGAQTMLDRLWASRTGVLSVQVISELAVNLRAKKRLDWSRIARIVGPYMQWPVIPLDPIDPLEAMRIADRHRIGYWDSLIVRAAVKARASILLTEDLAHGEIIEGIRIHNPFHRD